MVTIPSFTQILVIGGGLAGSTAATLLAQEGFDVTLLERDIFPRYHVVESMLPSLTVFADFLGVREKLEAHGFQRKPGGYLQWGDRAQTIDYQDSYTFEVDRAESDHLLLEHAKSQGVKVFEGIKVRDLSFVDDRPCSITWVERFGSRATGTLSFDVVLDASGQACILSKHYLKLTFRASKCSIPQTGERRGDSLQSY